MKRNITCPICQTNFNAYRDDAKACSKACSLILVRQRKPDRFCSFCKKEVTSRPKCWMRGENVFCDKKCEANFRKKRGIVSCSVCSSNIESSLSRKRKVCGNKECLKIHLRNTRSKREFTARRSFVEVFLCHMLEKNFKDVFSVKTNDRSLLDGLEMDIYIPEFKIGIECCGPCHFLPIHGEKVLQKVKLRDEARLEIAFKKGIKIISLKQEGSLSKGTKTKLLNIFIDLCSQLNIFPKTLSVDMKHVDAIYREGDVFRLPINMDEKPVNTHSLPVITPSL